ncbi:GTP cyclohydrolase II [Mameliella alba]|uniref:GTP cyclohydrolase II n=1 Tax=Mameliella alba TaxID=561184 RepID=UPI001431DFE2|nr:GTP cyclohydrolase II [Mameliella alba]
MGLGPDLNETLARARADLRMGVPVGLRADGAHVLVAAAETLSEARLCAMRALGPLDLALTDRRAATLKARAYDGDVARVIVPEDARLSWVQDPVSPGTAGAQGLLEIDGMEAAPLLEALPELEHVVSARVPLRAAENARLHIYRPADGSEEHYAIEIGRPDRARPVLARLHSACFTGDLLGSLKCDCGPQLNAALMQMGQEGAGVLLYLQQEGRGIGLANKMRAYALQDQGFDTVEANHRLGFEDDERDFRLGAQILDKMGFSAVRLMTNNPAKMRMMESCGIGVTERVPLKVGETVHNTHYLAVKAAKSGHLL